ncbi:hypothetical protein A8709_15110 [Paenibacillus pectinilyticus]|uniref:ABC transmembrane type-1 domain-containing protein n=1 Tax=Paenibacillus pectinilyticus TaxID=512399 RepID=A0A1C1A4B6_9BACL|nr:sugar ABC transporter permease [Paenibacillus pectinilyticus]OCT15407.1 hypothetical protein A8709_15110 [Paenibacillus pectinilyticus]
MKSSHKNLLGYLLFVLPALLIFLVFVYYPLFRTLGYSLTEWDGMSAPKFIGLKNFHYLIEDESFLQSAKNNVYFAVITMIIGNPLFLLLALGLNLPLKSRGFLRTLYYLPQLMSLMVISVIWGLILQFDGVFNTLLHTIGIDGLIHDWLGSRKLALNTIVLINEWQTAGFGAVIYLAGLQSIPEDLYEAAKIDGASAWRRLWHITLPLLMPSFSVINFLLLVGGMRYFDIPFVMTNGGPGDATSTMALKVYKFAFVDRQMGYATAASVAFMVVIVALTSILLYFTRKREVEY